MNEIHPTAIISEDVILGDNNEIGAYAVIEGPTKIGDNNIISHHVVIGTPGEDTRDPRHDSKNALIEIGDNNIIREFTSVQKPCYEKVTKIKNDVFIMHGAHIPHDAFLDDQVVVTPLCIIGGIAKILRGANIGMGAQVHQYSIVGQYSLVAMGTSLTKNVKPFTVCINKVPPRVNTYAIKKFGFENFEEEITKYVLDGVHPKSNEIKEIVERFEELHLASNRKLYD